MNGILFDIQRFCTKDGPGIRTTAFFKGCPLRCLWCHNPESQKIGIEQMKKAKEEGSEQVGREYSVDQVMEIVLKDRLFYENSDGGLTLSGGEPLFQPEFALALMERAKKEGLHLALETCGMVKEQVMRESAKWVDLYLFDFKESNEALCREYIGGDLKPILKNLEILEQLSKKIILRCPIIPSINDREDHFEAIAALAEKNAAVAKVEIEPYHSLGADKYRRLGREYQLSSIKDPEKAQVEEWIALIQRKTAKAVERA